MSESTISLIAFAVTFGGALFGMFLRTLLKEHHLSTESRDVMKLGTGMIATMAALVLSLLIASAKGTFDTVSSGIAHIGAKTILLDRTMARYGPETKEPRDILRRTATATIERLWSSEKTADVLEKVGQGESGIELLEGKLRQLSPRNDDQRQLQSRALQISGEINETRLLVTQHVGQRSFPMPLLVLLITWLAVIFSAFGLLTSRNAAVVAVLFVCALSAASALFLILELDQPFGGLIKVSSAPLQNALAHLGR